MANDVSSGRATNSVSGIINKKGEESSNSESHLKLQKAVDRSSVIMKKRFTFHRNQSEFGLLRFLLKDHTK